MEKVLERVARALVKTLRESKEEEDEGEKIWYRTVFMGLNQEAKILAEKYNMFSSLDDMRNSYEEFQEFLFNIFIFFRIIRMM